MSNSDRKSVEVGEKYGRMTVLSTELRPAPSDGRNRRWATCRCDCGNVKDVRGAYLRIGMTKSCGCYVHDSLVERMTTHGGAKRGNKDRLYVIRASMLQRCTNPKDPRWDSYGGAGVIVDPLWSENYEAFRDWALSNGYRDNLSIDRIDPNGNYEPDNCRWADSETQMNNKKNNRHLTAFGDRMTLAQWARDERCLVGLNTLRSRMRKGLDAEMAMSTPAKVYNRKKRTEEPKC